MYYLILACVIAIVLIAFYKYNNPKGETLTNIDEIVASYATNKKNGGTIFDFRRAIGDPSFSPYKYGQLTTLYNAGTLSHVEAEKVLSA
jgi:hypothetical protein